MSAGGPEISRPLVQSPDAHNRQGWARSQELHPRSPSWARGPRHLSCRLPRRRRAGAPGLGGSPTVPEAALAHAVTQAFRGRSASLRLPSNWPRPATTPARGAKRASAAPGSSQQPSDSRSPSPWTPCGLCAPRPPVSSQGFQRSTPRYSTGETHSHSHSTEPREPAATYSSLSRTAGPQRSERRAWEKRRRPGRLRTPSTALTPHHLLPTDRTRTLKSPPSAVSGNDPGRKHCSEGASDRASRGTTHQGAGGPKLPPVAPAPGLAAPAGAPGRQRRTAWAPAAPGETRGSSRLSLAQAATGEKPAEGRPPSPSFTATLLFK